MLENTEKKPQKPEPLPGGQGPVDPEAKWIEVARVGRPHGLKGDLRLQIFNDESELWEEGLQLKAWLPGRPAVLLEIETFRDILPMPTALFKGINDRDVAAKLTHAVLAVDARKLPETDEDEFYLHELMGAQVLDDATRELLGTVRAILETPADVLEILLKEGGVALLPVESDAITEMGREKNVLVVKDLGDWSEK